MWLAPWRGNRLRKQLEAKERGGPMEEDRAARSVRRRESKQSRCRTHTGSPRESWPRIPTTPRSQSGQFAPRARSCLNHASMHIFFKKIRLHEILNEVLNKLMIVVDR